MSNCTNSVECCPDNPFAYAIAGSGGVADNAVTYWNTEQIATCGEGSFTVPAHTYSSQVSQAAANALALAAAEAACT
jgi:hypothetical protein